jgi:hypothetical protein
MQSASSLRYAERTGNPIINADFSRSRADQPDQDNDIQSFRQIEEIVEPIESRDAFRNRRQLDRRDRDDHLDDESRTTQAREHSDNEQTSADEFNRGNEIGHEMRKRYPGAGQGFIHLASPARYEELIAARNGEKYSERYAGEQNRKFFPRRVSEQYRPDQWRDFHGVSFSVSNRIKPSVHIQVPRVVSRDSREGSNRMLYFDISDFYRHHPGKKDLKTEAFSQRRTDF